MLLSSVTSHGKNWSKWRCSLTSRHPTNLLHIRKKRRRKSRDSSRRKPNKEMTKHLRQGRTNTKSKSLILALRHHWHRQVSLWKAHQAIWPRKSTTESRLRGLLSIYLLLGSFSTLCARDKSHSKLLPSLTWNLNSSPKEKEISSGNRWAKTNPRDIFLKNS